MAVRSRGARWSSTKHATAFQEEEAAVARVARALRTVADPEAGIVPRPGAIDPRWAPPVPGPRTGAGAAARDPVGSVVVDPVGRADSVARDPAGSVVAVDSAAPPGSASRV